MFKKLRNKFLLMHMSIVSALVFLFFGSVLGLTYAMQEQSADRRLDRLFHMRSMTTEIFEGVQVTRWGSRGIINVVEQGPNPSPVMAIRAEPGIFITLDEQGQIAAVTSVYQFQEDLYNDIAQRAIGTASGRGKVRVDPWGYKLTFKYQQIGNEIIFIDISHEVALFNEMLRMFLFISLPLLGVIFFVSLFFARSSIRPIEASYNKQKEFIADASHELKTPLAAISANLDVLSGAASPEQQKWLSYIRSEVKRMTGLTGSLLYLAKMDFVSAKGTHQAVDFSVLIEDCLLPLEAVLFEKGMGLQTNIGQKALVHGDEGQLRQLVGILTDNALRYGKSIMEVKVKKTAHHVIFTVANDGPGIEKEKLAKIWERFYRCDGSREYTGGFGLGLPMAQAIVEQHNGKISCESESGGQTIFRVALPAQ